jgi:hypothetical protein
MTVAQIILWQRLKNVVSFTQCYFGQSCKTKGIQNLLILPSISSTGSYIIDFATDDLLHSDCVATQLEQFKKLT